MNESSYWWEQKDHRSLAAQIAHTALGYSGLLFNSIILYVTATQRGSRLLGVLAVADMTLNLREICDSTFRILAMVQTADKHNYMVDKIPQYLCLFNPTFTFGAISRCYVQQATAMISLERLISVMTPMWYNANWEKNEGKYVLWFVAAAAVPIVYVYIMILLNPYAGVQPVCSNRNDPLFILYISYGNVIFSIFAVVATALAVIMGKRLLAQFSSNEQEKAKTFKALNRTAVVVVGVNFWLITVISFIDSLKTAKYIDMTQATRSAMLTLPIANSTINLPCLLLTSGDFRRKCMNALAGRHAGNRAITVGGKSVAGPRTAHSTHR